MAAHGLSRFFGLCLKAVNSSVKTALVVVERVSHSLRSQIEKGVCKCLRADS